MLKGIPIAACEVQAELTTPTGAAIVATLAESFGPVPPMAIEKIGYGAGDKDFKEQGNVLRLLVGESSDVASGNTLTDKIDVLETNLDDVTGEVIAHCSSRLMTAGALDVYTAAIQMKKGRPATKLTVLCESARRAELEQILFQETGTLGIRRWTATRSKLPREAHSVETSFGSVAGKVAELPDGTRRFTPEFDACQQIASAKNVAIDAIYEAARKAFVK